MFNPDYSWIPFHVVACSSEEYGTSVELVSTQPFTTNRSWESARTATFPQEIVLRFHTRCEVSHLIFSTKLDKNVPEVEFHVGDGLSGSFLDVEYRLAGKAYNLNESLTQVKLNGFGSYLKIVFLQAPKRSHKNPYGQVSIGALKIWGRFSGYHHGMKNDEIPVTKDNKEVEKILIGMGIPLDLLAWYEEGERNFEYAPIDEDTRETIRDLDGKRDKARLREDYEGLKQLTEDIKKVFDIGRDIWSLQKELEFAVAKEDFNKALDIKARLKKLVEKRDTYDALYETTRYENMIIMQRPSTADILAQQNRLDDEQRAERERRRRELEEQERRRILEEEKRRQQLEAEKGIKDAGEKPWWEKSQGGDVAKKKKKKEEKKKDEDVIETGFNNPFAWNEGDVDLDLYFRPLLANAGEKLKDIPLEVLRRLQHLGYLNIFGAKLWTAAYSENWRIREAAAQAVLNFLEMPILEKYLNGKSKKLFLAALEVAKIACEDKLLQIYFIGLKILSTALTPPICGSDVSPQILNKAIKEFLPILLEKISELNFRARDISLHTLLSLFRHPGLEIGNLIVACMDICDFGDDVRPKNPIPIDKQQHRLLLARLEIILHVLQEYDYNPNAWNWEPVFRYLLSPALFHSNSEVRFLAIEDIALLYQYLGPEIRQEVANIDNLKPNLKNQIFKRFDEIDHLLAQNQDTRKMNGPLAEVAETAEEHNPPPSSDAKFRSNMVSVAVPTGKQKNDPKQGKGQPSRDTSPQPQQQVQQPQAQPQAQPQGKGKTQAQPLPTQNQAQANQPQSVPSGGNNANANASPSKPEEVQKDTPKKKKWGLF